MREKISNISRIGVISDTHVPSCAPKIPEKALEIMKGAGLIIHCGDVVSAPVISLLSTIAPVITVKGNMDPDEIDAPSEAIIRVNEKFTICASHGAGPPSSIQSRLFSMFAKYSPDLIVFGHTHTASISDYMRLAMFNPGSCTAGEDFNSIGIIEVTDSCLNPRIIRL